ncbi:MAG: hypothetical protein AAFY71_15260 [Bacteroidota bacterium]
MRFSIILGAIILSLILGGCRQGEEPGAPIYLKLGQGKVKLSEDGFTSDIAIKDFWMSHNANNLGVFQVPNVVPLIPEEGENRVFVNAGVWENGFSDFRLPYPFWRGIAVDVSNASPLDTIEINPTFEFLSADTVINFAFNEEFETGSSNLSDFYDGPNGTLFRKSGEAAFQGRVGLKATFTKTSYNLLAIGTSAIPLPQQGANDVWMEITYKSDVTFSPGLFYTVVGNGETGDIRTNFFNSNGEWRTAYLHVNQSVRSVIGTALFTPYIRATSQFPNSDSIGTGTIMIDNFRILHFR